MATLAAAEIACMAFFNPGFGASLALSATNVHNRTGENWVINSSRILAPAIIYWASRTFGLSLRTAGAVLAWLSLAATNSILWVASPSRKWAAPVALAVLIFALRYSISFSWDWTGLLAMSAFMVAASRDAPPTAFAAIFGFQLFNRESALFIPLWLILSSWTRETRFDWPRLIVGVAALVGGLVVIEALRGGAITNPVAHLTATQTHMMDRSLFLLGDEYWRSRYIVYAFLTLLAFSLAIVNGRLKHWGATALTVLLMVLAQLAYAHIDELRIWWDVIPFALLPLVVRQAKSASVSA